MKIYAKQWRMNKIQEKAIELAQLCNGCMEGNPAHPCNGCSSCEQRGVYYGALEMADWMIEKAVEWLENNATDHLGFNPISETFSLSWDFIDLFKQAMEK